MRTRPPSATPSLARSSGCTFTRGGPCLARLVGISLKEELRYSRDGLVASRNGCLASAFSITSQWSGRPGTPRSTPKAPGRGAGTFFQSGLKRNFLSG